MYKYLLFFTLPLYAMAAPDSPQTCSPQTPKTPIDTAVCLSYCIFDQKDEQFTLIFSQILTKEHRKNIPLAHLRCRMVHYLEVLSAKGSPCSSEGSGRS
jgi:hypothetical protein